MKNNTITQSIVFLLFASLGLFIPSESKANNRDACMRISEGAMITGTKVLVIGIEGLASFSTIGTKKAYEYRCKVTRGLAANPPGVGFGGFVLKNLIIPVIEEYKNQVEVLVVSHGDGGSSNGKAYHCAKIWMSEKRPGSEGRKVILVGHSFGGYALPKLTGHLGNTPIAGVLSIDARFNDGPLRAKMSRKGKVERWENYFQTMPLRGYEVEGADVNQRLTGKGHTGLPGHATVKSALKRMIGDPPGPKVVATDLGGCGAIAKPGSSGEFRHQGTERDENMRSHSGISGDVDTSSADVSGKPPVQSQRKIDAAIRSAQEAEKKIEYAPLLKAQSAEESTVTEASSKSPKCPKGSECHFGYNIFTGQKEYIIRPIKDFASGRSQMGEGVVRSPANTAGAAGVNDKGGVGKSRNNSANKAVALASGETKQSSASSSDLSSSDLGAENSFGEEVLTEAQEGIALGDGALGSASDPILGGEWNSLSSQGQRSGSVSSGSRFVPIAGASGNSSLEAQNSNKVVGKILWKTIQASKATPQTEDHSLFHRVRAKIQIKMMSTP